MWILYLLLEGTFGQSKIHFPIQLFNIVFNGKYECINLIEKGFQKEIHKIISRIIVNCQENLLGITFLCIYIYIMPGYFPLSIPPSPPSINIICFYIKNSIGRYFIKRSIL